MKKQTGSGQKKIRKHRAPQKRFDGKAVAGKQSGRPKRRRRLNKKEKRRLTMVSICAVVLLLVLIVFFPPSVVFWETETQENTEGVPQMETQGNMDGLPQTESQENADGLSWWETGTNAVVPSGVLEVHFIDCGQGDCTLLVCDGHAMLIDAGPEETGTKIQYYLLGEGIETLDYLAITHYDTDHAGGADVILQKLECREVILPNYEQANNAYRNIYDSLEYISLSPTYPEKGQEFWLGEAVVTVISDPSVSMEEVNDASLCFLVRHGENTFLFTGDAEDDGEEALFLTESFSENSGENSGGDTAESSSGNFPSICNVDVYQVGHHGSDTSSGEDFLQLISPLYAVISCGAGNAYGHPHQEVLERLEQLGSEIYRTDLQGTIIAVSDGREITWSMLGE